MKKLLFFMTILPVFIFGQWTETFDSGTTLPAGWAVINSGSSNGWDIRTPYSGAHSGTKVAGITFNIASTHNDYLITKAIDVQAGISDMISFYVKSDNAYYLDDYEVLLSTTDQTQSAFTTVLQATENAPATWTRKTLSLSAYAGQTVYIAIHATDNFGFYLFADSFSVDTAPVTVPACTVSTSPLNGATGVNTDGVLNWSLLPSATGYRITVGTTSGGTDVADNIDVGDTPIYNLPGVLNSGTTYYATIIPYNTFGNAVGCTEFSFTTAQLPANDECDVAISLPVSNTEFCANPVNGTTNGATQSTGTTPNCASDGINDDVWYSFTATANIHMVTVTYVNTPPTATQVYSGSCGALTGIGCSFGSNGNSNVVLQNLTVGQVYYVRVYTASTIGTASSDFSICISTPTFPANDTCDTAIAIACGGTVQGNNALAENEILPASTCGSTSSSSRSKGIWYKVTAVATGPITVSACGSEFIGYLRVYTGGCSGLTCVSNVAGVGYANTGCGGFINAPSVTFNATAGSVYYVLFTSGGGAHFGKYTISVTQNCSLMGTSDRTKENHLKAHPNPFEDVLNISDVSKVKSVAVLDGTGRVVKTIENPSSALQLGDLKQGMYLVTLNMRDGSKQTIKAIKK